MPAIPLTTGDTTRALCPYTTDQEKLLVITQIIDYAFALHGFDLGSFSELHRPHTFLLHGYPLHED